MESSSGRAMLTASRPTMLLLVFCVISFNQATVLQSRSTFIARAAGVTTLLRDIESTHASPELAVERDSSAHWPHRELGKGSGGKKGGPAGPKDGLPRNETHGNETRPDFPPFNRTDCVNGTGGFNHTEGFPGNHTHSDGQPGRNETRGPGGSGRPSSHGKVAAGPGGKQKNKAQGRKLESAYADYFWQRPAANDEFHNRLLHGGGGRGGGREGRGGPEGAEGEGGRGGRGGEHNETGGRNHTEGFHGHWNGTRGNVSCNGTVAHSHNGTNATRGGGPGRGGRGGGGGRRGGGGFAGRGPNTFGFFRFLGF